MYFSTVRVTFLTVKHLWDFPVCGYRARTALNVCSGCLPEQYIFFLISKFARNIRTYPLSNAAEQHNPNAKQGSKRKFKGVRVSVINENNVGTYMYLEEAEKYANRNNLSLVELQDSTREKPKYKLQRVSGAFETQKDIKKVQSKKIKQILLREGICKNDLLVKVNQMLKFLEKDFKVICVVECKDNEKLDSIISEINTIGLQGYSFNKTQTARGMKISYEPKSTEPEENS